MSTGHRQAASVISIRQHAVVQRGGYHAVIFHGRRYARGRISGRIPAAVPGIKVHLQASKYPFMSAFHRVQTTTTGRRGRFHFVVTPQLATKYRVSALTMTSRVVKFFVVAGFREVQAPTCKAQPTCNATSVFRYFYPAKVAQREGHKRWYLYQAVRRKCCGQFSRLHLTTNGSVKRTRVSPTTYRVSFTFPISYHPHRFRYRFGVCQRETEHRDGFGIPHHFGPCGAPRLSYSALASPAVG